MNFFLAILIFVDTRNWVFLWATKKTHNSAMMFVCVCVCVCMCVFHMPGIMDCQRTDKEQKASYILKM